MILFSCEFKIIIEYQYQIYLSKCYSLTVGYTDQECIDVAHNIGAMIGKMHDKDISKYFVLLHGLILIISICKYSI